MNWLGWTACFFLLTVIVGAQTPTPSVAPSPPHRVISMAPNLTEIVYDIGAQDLLVGVTDFCKFPPEARTKEKIGGWINPNYEKIVSLKPDLVLVLQFHGKIVDNLRTLKVPILTQDCQTVEDVLRAYDILGKALGRVKAAAAARRRLEKKLAKIRRTPVPGKELSVLFVIDRTPGALDQIYGVGPGNFIDSIIRWTGGVNILADSPVPYPLVSKEQMIKRDPDIILNSLPPTQEPDQVAREAAVWEKMPILRAVKEHHVYCFNNEDYLVPGPTMVKLAEFLAGILRQASRTR